MRDPVKTKPRDTVRDPMRDDRTQKKGMGRWLWAGGLVLLALILVMWLTGGGVDVVEEVDVTPTATLPADAVTDSAAVEEVPIQPATGEAEAVPVDPVVPEANTIPATPPE